MAAFDPGYVIRIAVVITDRDHTILGCEARKEKIDPRRLLARGILVDIDETELRIITFTDSRAYGLGWPVVHPIISEVELIQNRRAEDMCIANDSVAVSVRSGARVVDLNRREYLLGITVPEPDKQPVLGAMNVIDLDVV